MKDPLMIRRRVNILDVAMVALHMVVCQLFDVDDENWIHDTKQQVATTGRTIAPAKYNMTMDGGHTFVSRDLATKG
jgi:hypothetical protein